MLEAVSIFKLRFKKAYHDGHTDIMIDIYSCIFLNKTFWIFENISVRPSITDLEAVRIFKLRGQKAYHDEHTFIMNDIYSKHSTLCLIFCTALYF